MNRWCIALLAVITLTSNACQLQAHSVPAPASQSVPALLTESTQADRQQISRIVGDALNRESEDIQLSQSVFTRTHLLIIQRLPDKSNSHLYGQSFDMPNHFTLLKDSQGCLIHHRQSGRDWRLENLQCNTVESSQ